MCLKPPPMIPEDWNDSSSPSSLWLVHCRCEPAYKILLLQTCCDRTWQSHNDGNARSAVAAGVPLTACVSGVFTALCCSFLMTHPDVCLFSRPVSLSLTDVFSLHLSVSCSLNLSDPHKICCPDLCQPMLNPRQCNRPPGQWRLKFQGPTLY